MNALKNALPIVAQAYGNAFGVKVQVGGSDAYTDGETIVIPNIPDNAPQKTAIWGYLAHEAAHVRFTDFGTVRAVSSPIEKTLLNIVEDSRIESRMVGVYPGAQNTLLDTMSYLLDNGMMSPPEQGCHPAQALQFYCLVWLRYHANKQSILSGQLSVAERLIRDSITMPALVRLKALLNKISTLETSWDALSLAQEIVKMIEEEAEQANDSNEPDSGRDSGQADDSDEPDSGRDTGQADDSDDSNSSSDDEASTEDSGNNGGSGDSEEMDSTSKAGSGSSDEGGEELGDKMASILSAGQGDLAQDLSEQLKEEMQTLSSHTVQMPVTASRKNTSEWGKYQAKSLEAGESESLQLRRKLKNLVESKNRVKRMNARKGSKLNSKRLTRVLSGDTRVFNKEHDKKSPNTAIQVLVDMSGSMQGDPCDIAVESAYAISLALSSLKGVTVSVAYFDGDDYIGEPVIEVLGFGENPRHKRNHFPYMPTNRTPMASGLWYSAFNLVRRKEPRKIAMVITDGTPNEGAEVMKIVKKAEAAGIELIGVGVKTNSVEHFFNKNCVINSVADLKTTLFSLMKELL